MKLALAKYFTHRIKFNSHNNPIGWILLAILFFMDEEIIISMNITCIFLHIFSWGPEDAIET